VPEALSRARRWSAPERFGDATGLGGGLVYALDSSFCKTMLPRFLEATQFTDALALTEILSPSCAPPRLARALAVRGVSHAVTSGTLAGRS
jgi:hypothetical protein